MFVTGQREVENLCDRLRSAFVKRKPTAGVIGRKGDLSDVQGDGSPATGEEQEEEFIEASGNDKAEEDADFVSKILCF